MTKKEIINLLEEFADLLEFKGENIFKINAFRNGALSIRRFEGDFEDALITGNLFSVKGIGKGIRSFIEEYNSSGLVSELELLRNEVPAGIREIMEIRGLGVKKVRALCDHLGIEDISSLEEACINQKVKDLKGFGEKIEQKILHEIEELTKNRNSIHLHRATSLFEKYKSILLNIDSYSSISEVGELRRKKETISHLEILIYTTQKENIICEVFPDEKEKTISDFQDFVTIKTSSIKVTIHFVDSENSFKQKLLGLTGSTEFLSAFSTKVADCSTEEEFFKSVKIPYIIPEMRETEYFSLPDNLRMESDLKFEKFKGLIHFHTHYSDGENSLLEMRTEAAKLGFEYIVVCDHSKSAFYANGLTEDRLLIQKEEIKKLNRINGPYILHGIESDILKDGSLDYDESILREFDFIVASVHSIFSLTEDEMTARIIKAIENPYTKLIGHPTGRLLLSRQGYALNVKKILEACKANDVAIEINSNPHRLDLAWKNIFYSREIGVRHAINPDAHSIKGIRDIRWGIDIAKKAGLQSAEVINCLSFEEFKEIILRR
ncbi:MAG: PHP domain-containing protein [Ignavibacteriales bacterium]|nr:PHP domain-containing protein [Ignavibacteriales bacterium]